MNDSKRILILNEPDGRLYSVKFKNFLHVHSCGVVSYSPFKFERRKGTPDYMITLIVSGTAKFYSLKAKKNITVQQGDIVIYKPKEYHLFEDCSKDLSRYWVHFTGTEALNILKECNLDKEQFYKVTDTSSLEKIFLKILFEIRSDYISKQIKINGYLLELISEISRLTCSNSKDSSNLKAKIAPAIEFMNVHYMDNFSIEDLAKKCFLSKSYFLRIFKEYTGTSPYEYLTCIRIDYAKDLLMNTNIKISTICNSIGMPDQNQFTKIFKRHTEMTPSAYRKNHK